MTAAALAKRLARRVLPRSWWDAMRVALGRATTGAPAAASHAVADPAGSPYEALYDEHARRHDLDSAIGDGWFDLIGRIELGVLLMEGLRPTDTLVDFGCGTGRLALHAVPVLVGGHYVGIDISRQMLAEAERRLRRVVPQPPCRVSWLHQGAPDFPLEDRSADMICAFSVFTHMEHEDSYLYLQAARRVARPGSRLVFSCLPMDLADAHRIFRESASLPWGARWKAVRNVTTSRDLMESIATLAGWRVLRWYPGNQPSIVLPDSGERKGLGQSVCVLERPRDDAGPAPRGPAAP